jgi:hypothetical protein
VDQEEKSLVITVAILSFFVGIVGAGIGGYCTLKGAYWSWDQQQKTLDNQQTEELNNIAQALYIDISFAEARLNGTFVFQSQLINKSRLNDPKFFSIWDKSMYDKDGLYYIFNKDISRFDNITSRNLYIFYNNIIELENKRQYTYSIYQKSLQNERVSRYDTNLAHTYTVEAFNDVPTYIAEAEILKKQLIEGYSVIP